MEPSSPNRRVVVTGLGALSGACVGADELWDAVTARHPGPTHRSIVGFEPRAWLDRRVTQRTDGFAQTAIVSGRLAHEDAGSPTDDPDRVAVVMGTGNGGVGVIFKAHQDLEAHGREAVSLLSGVMAMSNAGAANLAFDLGSRGPTYAVASGCASGTHAVVDGFRLIRQGLADVAYVGGSEGSADGRSMDDDPTTIGLINLRVHSEDSVSRPFDVRRSGFLYAAGAAVMRLETLDAARARGAHVYAEVLGGANTVDGYDMIQPSPGGAGLVRCMRLALGEAGVEPADIVTINCHGTGTHHNDLAESQAAISLFGRPGPALTSTKAITGHSGAAAGAIEAVLTVMSIDRQLIPQTQWCDELDPEIEADVVVGNEPRPWTPGLAISNSVGLGGQNGTVVLGPAPSQP